MIAAAMDHRLEQDQPRQVLNPGRAGAAQGPIIKIMVGGKMVGYFRRVMEHKEWLGWTQQKKYEVKISNICHILSPLHPFIETGICKVCPQMWFLLVELSASAMV